MNNTPNIELSLLEVRPIPHGLHIRVLARTSDAKTRGSVLMDIPSHALRNKSRKTQNLLMRYVKQRLAQNFAETLSGFNGLTRRLP